jgi:hypothetical protein
MKMNKRLILILGIAAVVIALPLAYHHWGLKDSAATREEMLAALPGDPSAVLFVDLAQFRSSAFLSQLMAWAPQLPLDEDYTQFVQATGFNYERDLTRIAVAFIRQPTGSFAYVIADGRFDRNKIENYAARNGNAQPQLDQARPPLFALKLKNSPGTFFFKFLSEGRIAWTNDPSYGDFFVQHRDTGPNGEWKKHFERLAGSPLFGAVRQDAASAAALAHQAPWGFRSPQLAALLSQLDWITVGARPDGTILRVAAEGECSVDTTIHQLKDFLGGILLLAEVGLNGPKNRKELDPQVREAYLELLKSAQVEEVARGTGKSVRVVFEVTPAFLDAARAMGTKSAN